MNAVLEPGVTRSLEAGQKIFLEGDKPLGMYRVEKGWIKLSRCSSNGREVITELLFPGDYFDVPSLLGEQPYVVTASALGNLAAQSTFYCSRALTRSQGLLQAAHSQCLQRIGWQRQMMAALATERVEIRTLLVLEMLARRAGSIKGGQWSIPMPLTRLEFAEVIGTTTETAIRTLSEFRRRGLICENGNLLTCSLDLLGARAMAA